MPFGKDFTEAHCIPVTECFLKMKGGDERLWKFEKFLF